MPSTIAAALIFLALALVILGAVVIAERLGKRRSEGASHAANAQRMAQATGHPSARVVRRIPRPEREKIALEVAGLLTTAGMKLARPLSEHDVQVHARGEDGDYVLHAGDEFVDVSYRTNAGTEHLGRYMATYRAAQRVTLHAGLTSHP